MTEGIAALMLRPAIENFVKQHPNLVVQLKMSGPMLHITLYDGTADAMGRVAAMTEFTTSVFTPAQQVAIVGELFKIVGRKP